MRRHLRKRLERAFCWSALLHFVVVFGIYFAPSSNTPQTKMKPPPEPTILDLKEPTPIPEPIRGSVPKTPVRTQSSKKPRPSLKALTPSFKPALGPGVEAGQIDSSTGGSDGVESRFDDPQSYGLNAKTYDKGNAIYGFLEAVHARINNALIFDSILAQYNHFGTVYLEFVVDRRGVLQMETLHANTDDRVLKVHVIRSALIPGLQKPLKESLWLRERESVQLRARFQFRRTREQATLWDQDPEKISGFALTFRRFTTERAVARTLGRHLVNGGINYDLFAMYEAWQKFNKAKERRRFEVDPFAVYKADPLY